MVNLTSLTRQLKRVEWRNLWLSEVQRAVVALDLNLGTTVYVYVHKLGDHLTIAEFGWYEKVGVAAYTEVRVTPEQPMATMSRANLPELDEL